MEPIVTQEANTQLPTIISSAAALVSAISALFMTYMYRRQGKGFVWIKDQKIDFRILPNQEIYLALIAPLYNLGSGNIRFINLRVKKVLLKTKSIENKEFDMDEAYFPPGVLILNLGVPLYSDDKQAKDSSLSTQIRVHKFEINPEQFDGNTLQGDVNKKLEDIGEILMILTCKYKDGSWFGLRTKKTIISLASRGLELNYLSPTRKKELKDLFK